MARNVSNSTRRYLAAHGDGLAHGGFVFDTPEDQRKWENATLTRMAAGDWNGYDRPVVAPYVLTGAVLCELRMLSSFNVMLFASMQPEAASSR